MKIKKILIVPADRVVMNSPVKLLYSGEFIFYSDIPKVLGKENTYVYGTYSRHLTKGIPNDCPYPSCHNAPVPTFVDNSNVDDILSSVDVVLISVLAKERGDYITKQARKSNKPIVLFDFPDHETNYGSDDVSKKLCYGKKLGDDYDLYFKKDLPLGYSTEFILPIAPVPVRPESFNFKQLEKKHSIFYSGRGHGATSHPGYQKDRKQTVNLIKGSGIKNIKFALHGTNASFMSTRDYWDNMSKSMLCLSPSGRVWDSFRHTETGLLTDTGLIAPKPWTHTTGPELKDGVNSILYDTELVGNKYSLVNENELLEKIKYYLDNPSECHRIAKKWSEDVHSGHTIYARSKYIIETIEKKL
tara:strand:- start:629 stop:1702 length:1074 start_codon:yes stop_codon:yes gene_type:complete